MANPREKLTLSWPVHDTSAAQGVLCASCKFQQDQPGLTQTVECLERLSNSHPKASQTNISGTEPASPSGEGFSKGNGALDTETEYLSAEQMEQLRTQRKLLLYLARGLPVPPEALREVVTKVKETKVRETGFSFSQGLMRFHRRLKWYTSDLNHRSSLNRFGTILIFSIRTLHLFCLSGQMHLLCCLIQTSNLCL
jgi:hypothetical protein